MDTDILVKKAMKGNPDAFIEVIKNYEQVLYKTAYGFLKDSHDIEDVLQNTTLIAYESIGKLRDPKLFNTWVYRILVNESKKMLKERRQREQVVYQREEEKKGSSIHTVIIELDNKYKLPIVLHYYAGLSIREISTILSESEGTVKSKLHRGRELIRKEWM
jgi:RNA polymerase sigma-70 factor (ECF subfamily)